MAPPKTYIWQHKQWPKLTFDHEVVGPAIAAARRLQGEMEGKAGAIGLDQKGEVDTEVLAVGAGANVLSFGRFQSAEGLAAALG